jgi:CHAT domain-containing protein
LPRQSLEEGGGNRSLRPLGTVAEFADDAEAGQSDNGLDAACRRLFNGLFSKGAEFIEPQEPIVVVPYRELSVIPLALLIAPDNKRFVDHHAVSVLPSIAALTTMAKPQAAHAHAVVVGDPTVPEGRGLAGLSGAAKEAECVNELLSTTGMKTVPLIGDDATEARFRTAVAGARVVHLACHAALREPASASPLFLSPSEHDDGLLLPEEISDLPLDAALVVLSACESGLGRPTADGVLGLGRAFLRAGARAVLLSLWRVNDQATAYLMRQLYEGLVGKAVGLNGQRLDVAAALQRAQIATRDNVSDDASIWGPWILVGDGGWRLG